MNLKRYITTAMIAAALVAAGTVAATAEDGAVSENPGSGLSQVAETPPEAIAAAGVLGTARDSGDELPAPLAEALDAQAQFGMNPDLARRGVAETTHSVFVVPANGHVCGVLTIGEGASTTCSKTADLAAGTAGPATASVAGEAIAVWGVVPDGVDSVTVAAGGESSEVATGENAYLAVLPAGAPVESVGYAGPEGWVEFPVRDPADAFASDQD